MIIDRSKINFLPLIRGPLWDLKHLPKHIYSSVETLMLQFETDRDAIPPLLPEPYQPGKSPLVTVMFNDNNGVDFMAGGGYRFAAISVSAKIDSEDGYLNGDYVLAMPEDQTLPIITGREWLGMPKFFTDISPIRRLDNGHLRCEASMWGHLMFGIDISPPFKSQNVLIRKAAGAQATNTPAFGYKYIASLDGPPDADYPTIMWSDNKIDELQQGSGGEFYIGNPTDKDIGDYKPCLDALRALPVLKVTLVAHSLGSMVLRNDKNGRILV